MIVIVLNMVCPKHGPKLEGDVLLRVSILGLFCLKQGQLNMVRFS